MTIKVNQLGLCWIVVDDIKKAVKFYTEVVGLKLVEFHEEFKWAELEGHQGGARFGIGEATAECCTKSGSNAIPTFTVDNLDDTLAILKQKSAHCKGDIVEVPGHVRMQTVVDDYGNEFQFVQVLSNNH